MNPDAPKRRRLIWLFKGPWWWRVLMGLAGITILVSAFYAEEDWRGHRAWNEYRRSMEAAGISLELQTYIPKAIPDEENFAMSPIVKEWMDTYVSGILTNDIYARAEQYVYATNKVNGPAHRHFEDLVAWQQAVVALGSGTTDPNPTKTRGRGNSKPTLHFSTDKTDLASRAEAAPTVLEGMKPDEAEFAELRLASSRRCSRFPIVYRDDPAQTLLPHLARVKQVCQRLNFQACAELALGQTDEALADVKLSLYLMDSIKTEPFLISFLVRGVCLQIAVQSVWEGLAERRWTDTQLKELESCFARDDFVRDDWNVLKCERAFGVREIEVIEQNGLGYLEDNLTGPPPDAVRKAFLNAVGRAMPEGWFYLERLNYCAFFDAQIAGILNPSEKRVYPTLSSTDDNGQPLEFHPPSFSPVEILRHRMFADWLSKGLQFAVPKKTAVPQTIANQAAIACALERYRLANGQFPETLNSLVPQFIERVPDDVITGEPYKYHRTADGQFVLYSIGWNGKDDGGVSGRLLFDQSEGDWVWEYPVQ